MTPIDWATRPLKKYADFTGRAPRAEFWWFVLLIVVAGIVAMIIESALGLGPVFLMYGPLTLLVVLATLVPSIAVQVRRLHDTDRPGIWLIGFYIPYFIYLYLAMSAMRSMEQMQATGEVPSDTGSLMLTGVVGLVVLILAIILIVFFVKRGTVGDNRYGPDPYGGTSAPATA